MHEPSRVKLAFQTRVLELYESGQNRFVYSRVGTVLFVGDLKKRLNFPNTAALLQFLDAYVQKLRTERSIQPSLALAE